MDKETLLRILALATLVIVMRSLIAIDWNKDYKRTQKRMLIAGDFSDEECIDCQECCKGRFVDPECCKRCNGCDMYSDEAAAECRDYPN